MADTSKRQSPTREKKGTAVTAVPCSAAGRVRTPFAAKTSVAYQNWYEART